MKILLAGSALAAGLAMGACSAPAKSDSTVSAQPGPTTSASSSAMAGVPSTVPSGAGGQGGTGTTANRLADVIWSKFVAACPLAEQRMLVKKVVEGDVTGDKVPDTLVVDTCSTTTSYNPSTVEIFDGTSSPTAPRRVTTLLNEDQLSRPWVTGLHVDGGIVTITATGLSEHAAPACPDLTLTYRYQVTGVSAQRLSREAKPSKDCIRVTG